MLMNSGVEVHQSKAQFFADGRVFGPGSFVVSMAQPKQALVRWMLGRTFYPDNTYTRDKDNNPIRPYDMATDTFGEFMGVKSDPVGEKPPADLIKLTAHLPAERNRHRQRRGRSPPERQAQRQLPRRQSSARQRRHDSPRPLDRSGQAPRLRSRQAISSSPADRTPSSPMSPSKPASISRLRAASRRARSKSASRASRCFSATTAATWTKAGRG